MGCEGYRTAAISSLNTVVGLASVYLVYMVSGHKYSIYKAIKHWEEQFIYVTFTLEWDSYVKF